MEVLVVFPPVALKGLWKCCSVSCISLGLHSHKSAARPYMCMSAKTPQAPPLTLASGAGAVGLVGGRAEPGGARRAVPGRDAAALRGQRRAQMGDTRQPRLGARACGPARQHLRGRRARRAGAVLGVWLGFNRPPTPARSPSALGVLSKCSPRVLDGVFGLAPNLCMAAERAEQVKSAADLLELCLHTGVTTWVTSSLGVSSLASALRHSMFCQVLEHEAPLKASRRSSGF